jgi:hypothetical protein
MRRTRAASAALLFAALACGPGGDAASPASPAPPPLGDELEAARLEVATLRQALAEERADREALEEEVERLRREIEDLGWNEREPGKEEEEGAAEDAESGERSPGRPWFDAEALAKHRVQPAEIDRLRDAFDASELALLELEDRARREGWYDDPRYRFALRDMRLALRAELGDDGFDLLLFATGRHNRIVVDDLLRDSPAERAGLQRGDEILSYGDRRVFRGPELKRATTEGTAGERVEIVVLRDGARARLWVPRGPLGIRMRPESRPPVW